jgi:hypothetical protein
MEKDYKKLLEGCEITGEDLLKMKLERDNPDFIVKDFSPQVDMKQEGQFGDWHVDKEGNMTYKNERYFLDGDDLPDNTIIHMSEKAWLKWDEFMPAYLQALKNRRLEYVRIRVFYKKKKQANG